MAKRRKKRGGGVRAALQRGRATLGIHRRTRPGASPGTIKVDPQAPAPVITLIAYGPNQLEDRRLESPEEIRAYLGKHPVLWINVGGLGDAAVVEKIGEIFGLHRLALEDVVNVHQRAKAETYGEQIFLVARMAELNSHVATEQLSMFLGRGFVVTFQEDEGDCLDPVRRRIRRKIGRIRNQAADYLAYAVLDAVIDNYYPVLEELEQRMETLEDRVLERPDPRTIHSVHHLKRELLILRRAVWPHRDMLAMLAREPHPAVSGGMQPYLRDCYDHVVQILDLTETYREIASDLLELYLNLVNSRINETMRVLTIIATIFIPLTFVVGVYGMNFDWMPELRWRWGYPAVMAGMAVVALGMLAWFRARGWLAPRGRPGAASDGNEQGPAPV
ncbi:MAG: magnesium/cobalt transporter CorA [Planctomycetes bacterium]|nr:magnesium/cobalt transporter CorA [Planctomycetota bacterium]